MNGTTLKRDRSVGIVCIVLAALIAYGTTDIKAPLNAGDPGPKLFPLIGCAILIICGIAMLLGKKRTKPVRTFLTKQQWKRAGLLFALYILDILLMWIVGFTVSNVVMLFVLCLLFSAGNKKTSRLWAIGRALLYTAILSALLYLAYVVGLDLQLPEGLLWSLFK